MTGAPGGEIAVRRKVRSCCGLTFAPSPTMSWVSERIHETSQRLNQGVGEERFEVKARIGRASSIAGAVSRAAPSLMPCAFTAPNAERTAQAFHSLARVMRQPRSIVVPIVTGCFSATNLSLQNPISLTSPEHPSAFLRLVAHVLGLIPGNPQPASFQDESASNWRRDATTSSYVNRRVPSALPSGKLVRERRWQEPRHKVARRLPQGCQKACFGFTSVQLAAFVFWLENTNHQLSPRHPAT
jgi:hypothetical protein